MNKKFESQLIIERKKNDHLLQICSAYICWYKNKVSNDEIGMNQDQENGSNQECTRTNRKMLMLIFQPHKY